MQQLLVVLVIGVIVGQSANAQSVNAPYCVGLDVDGNAEDWDSCSSPQTVLSMRQIGFAGAGSDSVTDAVRVRFAHDGTHIYVLTQINGSYFFNLTGSNGRSHSFAFMWKVGEDATVFNMGGCMIANIADQFDCDAVKNACANSQCNCEGHMVDVWHMETSSPGALPGVQYPWRGPNVFPNSEGSFSSFGYDPTVNVTGMYQPSVERLFSGNDHTSNSDDEFSVHACLRGDDGSNEPHLLNYRRVNENTYRNQLRYAWSHSAIDSYQYPFGTNGNDGVYTYEMSRPLRTNENTDAQFNVGQDAFYAVAFWIPPEVGGEWTDAGHYVAPTNFQFGRVTLVAGGATATASATLFALLVSVVLSSVFVLGY